MRVTRIQAKFTRFQHLLFSLRFHVPLDYCKRRTTARYQKITRTPQMTIPKTSFNLWKFLKQFTSRNALQTIDYFRELVCRLTPENNVNVVNVCFNSDNGTVSLFKQRANNFLQSIAYFVSQYFSSVFDSPNQVVSEQICRVCAGLKFVFHSHMLAQPIQQIPLFVCIYLCVCVSNQSAFIPH